MGEKMHTDVEGQTNGRKPFAVAYTRFSTPQQAEGSSSDRQSRAAQEWATRNGYRLDDSSYEDLGVSAFKGRHRTHGALGAFVEAAQDGMFPEGTVLLVENPDRLSRQGIRASLRLLEEIVATGVDVVFLTTGRRFTADSLDDLTDMMLMLVEAQRAAEESRRKSVLVRRAWEMKREKLVNEGVRLTGRLPAWIRATNGRGEVPEFKMIDAKADVVRRIFRERAEGRGPTRIALDLNRDGIATFRHGKLWSKSTIVRLLASKAPIGVLVYGSGRDPSAKSELPNYYPAVISRPLWDKVQAMGPETPRGHTREPKSPVGLGLGRCGDCGAALGVTNKGKLDRASAGGGRMLCGAYRRGGKCEGLTPLHGRPGRGPARSVPLAEVIGALYVTLPQVLDKAPAVETELTERLQEAVAHRDALNANLDGVVTRQAADRVIRALDAAQAEVQVLEEATADAAGPLVVARLDRLRAVIRSEAYNTKEFGAAMRGVFRKMVFNWQDETWTAEWRHAHGKTVTFAATMTTLGMV